MSPPIYTPDGSEVSEIVLPDGSTASQVIGPDGNVVFEAGPDIPDTALTQDLVAWYRFGDGDARDYTATLDATFADTTAYDLTINGATFQQSGGVTDFDAGANSGVFDFDGSNDYLSSGVRLDSDLGLSNGFSVSVWFKGPGDRIGLQYNRDDARGLEIGTQFATNTATSGATGPGVRNRVVWDVDTTVYNHIYIGYNSSGDLDVIINNSKSALTTVDNDYVDDLYFGSTDFKIGSQSTPLERYFDGLIDDFRIYNRELTQSEVSDIYNATKP